MKSHTSAILTPEKISVSINVTTCFSYTIILYPGNEIRFFVLGFGEAKKHRAWRNSDHADGLAIGIHVAAEYVAAIPQIPEASDER
jgi:hypothetical protein